MFKYFWIFLSLIACINAQTVTTPVERHGMLAVEGTKIVDKNGEVVSFAGNSLFWSNDGWGAEPFYSRNVVEYLKDQWNSAIVRVALGVEENGAYLSNPASNKARMEAVVDAATELGLYVIIDWHTHHAEDHEAAAIDFFKEMAATYKAHPNVIFEIYNEPLNVSWVNVIKPYAERVIDAIRGEGAENLIIVGTPNWSQDVDVASFHPIVSEGENVRENIAYTIHFYAGTHKASLRQKALDAMSDAPGKGEAIALFCTEWGTVNADGNGAVDQASTEAWMTFLKEHDISHLNWAVNSKAEGSSIFKPTTNGSGVINDTNLTESGIFVKSLVLGWGEGNGEVVIQAPWNSHSSDENDLGLSFSYEILESGPNWFNAEITIINSGAPINGYTLGFNAPWSVTEFWNDVPGTESNGAFTVPVINHEFLSQINTGGSAKIGFTGSGTWSEPTNITWNGAPLESDSVSFEEWRVSYNVAGQDVDDDADGYDNLAEFFFGTSPNDASSSPEIRVMTESAGGADEGYFVVEFLTDPNATGVEYRFQVSNSLSGWNAKEGDGGMELSEITEQTDGMLKVKWKSVSPMSTADAPFFTRMQLR